jgi:hypothetical protein
MSAAPDHVHAALARTALLVEREIYPGLARGAVVEHLAATRIRICADERNVEETAGQAALTATVVAVAQLGVRLVLEVPEVEVRGPQPPLDASPTLAPALRELCADVIQPAEAEPEGAVELTVVIGSTPAPRSGAVLRVHGSAWEGGVTPDARERVGAFAGELPFGALLGAKAAAAEVFRLSMAALGRRRGLAPLAEHRIGGPAPVHLRLEPVELAGGIDLGGVDAVSGGAITNALLGALLRVPSIRGSVRVFDDDVGAADNLNRYELLRRSRLGMPKVEALASFSTRPFAIEAVPERLTGQTAAAAGGLREHVVVGVDHVPSRWVAQENASGWVCVGGTSAMEILVSEHVPGGPCAGCMHPYDDADTGEIPTVSFVSQLAGVLQAHRLLHRLATGSSLPPLVGYGLGLSGPRPLLSLGQLARSDCPVGCAASRG